MKPLAIDLFCGLGGWTEGLLAEGYDVIGFDIERHEYGEHRYPAQLVLQDVLTLHGAQFKDAALIVASPPCQEYSYMAMPWKLAKAKAKAIRADTTGKMLADLNRLFDACFRIQAQASLAAGRVVPLIVENVRGAEPWVGRARWNFGSFYLWGDVPALMPIIPKRIGFKQAVTHRNNGATRFERKEETEARSIKVGGFSWSDYGKPGYVPKAFNGEATKLPGFRFDGSGRSFQSESVKISGGGADGWFGKNDHPLRQHTKGHPARKAASAMLAKIPLPLSRHIAATYRP